MNVDQKMIAFGLKNHQRNRCTPTNEIVANTTNEIVGGRTKFELKTTNEIVAILKYPFPGVKGVPRTTRNKKWIATATMIGGKCQIRTIPHYSAIRENATQRK